MTRLGLAIALGAPALLLGAIAPKSAAQSDNDRAPMIRVYSQTGAIASTYVTPSIDLGEDAYVFAVSIDLDGQIQVLHPDFPGISVRLRRHQEFRLPNFFAGFSQSGGVVASDYYANRSVYSNMDDTRGVVIALASRQPFDLDRIESNGDWNMLAIRNLVDRRSPFSAAEALASYLGAKGEPIGRDFMRFASAHQNYYADYLGDQLYGCDPFYGSINPGSAFSRFAVLQRFRQFRATGGNARIIGFDVCGMPIVAYGRSGIVSAPPRRPPRTPADSGKVKGTPRGLPRHVPTGQPAAPQAALGYFPRVKPLAPPQAGDVTITASKRLSRSPGEILIDRRTQPATGVMPERTRVPVERTVPSTGAATGAQPVRQYNPPIPRENAPPPRAQPTQSVAPPPPPRYNPPPATASPPPRTETKTESAPPPHH
jgi:hypothetical protein